MGSHAGTDSDRGSFGVLLRSLRGAAGLSQEDLAERAGLTTHAISALERGTRTRPYPHTVRALADALGASAAQRSELLAAVPSRARAATGRQAEAVRVAGTGGLPVPATPLVARETELQEVVTLLRNPAQRIVTLTGTGGVGKTRLAVAVAASAAIADSFPGGVVFVELAPLLDAAAVLPAIAAAVGAGRPDGPDPASMIVDSVGTRQLLLVLDNFEHLLAAAPLVARLVEACPRLSVLVSSRAALRVRGESEYGVQPLAVPVDQPDQHALETSPSGALFLERARRVRPSIMIEPADARAIAGICRRLSGIPLALELAATRTRILDPPDLLARLDEALTSDGARDLPERQRTMTAALDWSYRLLDDPAKAVLRLMSVFSGGFTLEDLEGVTEAAGLVQRPGVLGVLAELVEHSLVVLAPNPGRRRYSLLEPIAQYARKMLEDAGEAPVVEAAHAEHYLRLAEVAAPHFERSQQVEWLDRVDAEHANMSAAIARATSAGAYEVAARMGWALREYWWLRGHLLHGRRAMELLLERSFSDRMTCRAEITAATMALGGKDFEAAAAGYQGALDRSSAIGDLTAQADAVGGLGVVSLARGDLELARAQLKQSIAYASAAGDDHGEWVAANVHVWLGGVEMHRGNLDAAVASIEQGLASARRRGDRLTLYIGLQTLSQIAVQRGDVALARRHLADGVRLTAETRDLSNLAFLLEALAVVEASSGASDRAPVLIGAAQGIRETIGTSHAGYTLIRPDLDLEAGAAARARDRLGDDRFDDGVDVGRAMSTDEAVAYAVAGVGDAD